MKSKKSIFIFIAILGVIIFSSVSITILDKNDNGDISDIYEFFPNFDLVLNKPDITQSQKDNAINNSRTFLTLCREYHAEFYNVSPSEVYEEYLQGNIRAISASVSEGFSPLYSANVDHEDSGWSLSCLVLVDSRGSGHSPPSAYFSTYRQDSSLSTGLDYLYNGVSSIYDDWSDNARLPSSIDDSTLYIQYDGV